MSEINVRLRSALADLMSHYDAQRGCADRHRKCVDPEHDLERLRVWIAVEMDAQKSLRSLAEVLQILLASEGLLALEQEVNPLTKKLSTLKHWIKSDQPTSTEQEEMLCSDVATVAEP